SPFRAQAAVRHVLSEASGDGHVGFPEELLREKAVELTQIPPAGITDAIEQLRITDEVVRDSVQAASGGNVQANPDREGEGGDDEHLVAHAPGSPESLIFLKPLFLAELGVARAIRALAKGPHPLPAVDVAAAIAWAEKRMDIAFADSQRAAIREALTRKLLVITGGPGTGKTTIVRAIIDVFGAKSLRVLLCAPT